MIENTDAEQIERLNARIVELLREREEAMMMLGDVPGKTLLDRLTKLQGWYMEMQRYRRDPGASRHHETMRDREALWRSWNNDQQYLPRPRRPRRRTFGREKSMTDPEAKLERKITDGELLIAMLLAALIGMLAGHWFMTWPTPTANMPRCG
jgi:hypothetical protein